MSVYKNMCLWTTKNVSKANVTLVSHDNFKLKLEGELILKYSVNSYSYVPLKFIVVNISSKQVLGLKDIRFSI